jgi:hypothetical protein
MWGEWSSSIPRWCTPGKTALSVCWRSLMKNMHCRFPDLRPVKQAFWMWLRELQIPALRTTCISCFSQSLQKFIINVQWCILMLLTPFNIMLYGLWNVTEICGEKYSLCPTQGWFWIGLFKSWPAFKELEYDLSLCAKWSCSLLTSVLVCVCPFHPSA